MNRAMESSTRPRLPIAALLAVLVAVAGCREEEVYSDYGHRGGWTETSLNGTRALGDLFTRAGHRVRSWSYLSPSLEQADVIVWFPDDFEPPSYEVEQWLYYWLTDGNPAAQPRVLVYVGRDFNAAPDYWQQMQSQAPSGLEQEYARRLAQAKGDAAQDRPATLKRQRTDDWFRLDPAAPPHTVQDLQGPWATEVDGTKAQIERHTRLVPVDDLYDTLLADEQGEPLASEFQYIDYDDAVLGRVIMIENGSWLLNARLVNHEHRKLAGRLVDAVGVPERQVVFLESGSGGPPIRETDPSGQPPTGLRLFALWPIGAVLTQLAVLGMVFALARWPVFGVPRRLARRSTTDFSSHIRALGRLLRDGRNRQYAIELLSLYRQSLRREVAGVDTTPPVPPKSPPSPRSPSSPDRPA